MNLEFIESLISDLEMALRKLRASKEKMKDRRFNSFSKAKKIIKLEDENDSLKKEKQVLLSVIGEMKEQIAEMQFEHGEELRKMLEEKYLK